MPSSEAELHRPSTLTDSEVVRLRERILTTRELNRALLARQLLLKRSAASLPAALERVAGLQMQYAPSGYIGLWSRLQNFRRDALTRALRRRTVVQATLLRATIHLVSARDYAVMTEAIRRPRRESWIRVARQDLEGVDMERVAQTLRRHLADGPRSRSDLVEVVTEAGYPRIAWSGAGLWLDVIRVPPSGTWERRRADLYGLAEDWLEPTEVTEDTALELLVLRYLRGFGPATSADVTSWAGLTTTVVTSVLERLQLRRFRDEEGRHLVDVPRAPLPDADTPAPVRFLPTWDATLLVHARRTRILPEEYRPAVFNTRTPQSVPTFLVDGAVAGTWKYDAGRVAVEPFAPLPRGARREVEDEAERLAAFHR